jgi:hypothetical protein
MTSVTVPMSAVTHLQKHRFLPCIPVEECQIPVDIVLENLCCILVLMTVATVQSFFKRAESNKKPALEK